MERRPDAGVLLGIESARGDQRSDRRTDVLRGGAAQHKQTFINIFNEPDVNGNSNRGGEIRLLIGGQYDNTNPLGGLVNAVNSANKSGISPLCAADGFCVAPYFDSPTDSTLTTACASIYPTQSDSVAYGTSYPWTVAQWCDVLRHYVKYGFDNNGGTGYLQYCVKGIASYSATTAGQSAAFVPQLVGYESCLETLAPLVAGSSGYLQHIATHDIYYNPDYYDVETAFLQACQFGGMNWQCHYVYLASRQEGANQYKVLDYGLYAWANQTPAMGTGETEVERTHSISLPAAMPRT